MERRLHTYNSGRIHRAGGGQRGPAPAAKSLEDEYLPKAEPLRPKKRRRWPIVTAISLGLVFALLGGLFVYGWGYIDDVLDSGGMGRVKPLMNEAGEEILPVAYNKKDVVHFLILGIDNEEGRNYGEGRGLTDMIMYLRYDLKNNKAYFLQIPRDSYMGENYATGGTGKINALLNCGNDQDNPINNIAGAFQQAFQLPVDYYLSIDMDSLKELVDVLGGLYTYVPREMHYDGGWLPQGWTWLTGEASEFFVRTRKGDGFARGDIDRLDNQRYFYSALFRRLLNMTAGDIVNMLPIIKQYCNTDLEVGDLIGIGIAGLNLKAEDVLFCKAPGATGPELDPTGGGRSMYILDLYGRGELTDPETGELGENPGLTLLLNTYFRDADKPVAAEELQLPQIQIPGSVALYPPNIQGMLDVQEEEGGADINVEHDYT